MFRKILFVILPVFVLFQGCNQKSREFHFTYSVDLLPHDGSFTRLWLPVPESNKFQDIQNLNVRSDLNYEIKTETTHGNTYLYAEFDGKQTQKLNVTLEFDVKRLEQIPHRNHTEPEKYLKPDKMVPVNHKFENILMENHLSGEDVRRIYDYVLDQMSYGKPKEKGDLYAAKFPIALTSYLSGKGWGRGDANYACDVGVGNCTDFHSYFMSLCRTSGVPVRFHMGFPLPDRPEGSIPGYHCWAEFYDSSRGWVPVDISEADKHPELTDFYFGRLDENRVEFSVDRDIPLENLSTGSANYFIYPIMEIDGKPSDQFVKSFSFRNL